MQGPADWDNPELARDIEKDDELPTTHVNGVGGAWLFLIVVAVILVIAFCAIKATA